MNDLAAWCNITFANASANPLKIAQHLYSDENTEITDLVIPDNVTNICDNLFRGCPNIVNLKIGDGVTKIGKYAFASCSGLTSVVIGNGVTTIDDNAFWNCNSIMSLTMGIGVLSVGFNAFSYPHKVIWLTKTPPTGYINVNGRINYVSNNQFSNLRNKTEYPLLTSTFVVGGAKYVPVNVSERTCDVIDCAYNSSAEKINIGKSVSYQGVSLKVKQIQQSAFYENAYIKDIDLNFDGDIKSYAFSGCINTDKVVINNNGVISSHAFENNVKMTSLEIGNNVSLVGSLSFGGCTNLKKALIGNSVEEIGSQAFMNCSNLDSITLGTSIKNIYNQAYANCTSVTRIVCNSVIPPVCDTQALYGISPWTCTLSVPKGCTAIYQTADQWKEFFFIEEHESAEDPTNSVANVPAKALLIQNDGGVITIQGCDEGEQVSVFGINGTQANSAICQNGKATVKTSLQSGSVAIVKVGNKHVKVVLK